MRKFNLLFCILFGAVLNGQVGFEDYYSEKDLLTHLQRARTASEQIDASGVLAVNYKKIFRDSLASIYLSRIYKIAQNASDPKLMAWAIWWDNLPGNILPCSKLFVFT